MTKRRYSLRLFAVVTAVALLAGACDGAEEATTAPPTSVTTTTEAPPASTGAPEPATTTPGPTTTTEARNPYGGTVVYGIDSEPATLNPLASGGREPVVDLLGQLWWAGAYDLDAVRNELVPDVLVELPTTENGGVVLNDDGTLDVRYEIREDAVWADGTPITGADFEFTLATILDPDNNIDTSIYEDILEHAAAEKTFEFTLIAPTLQYQLLFDVILPKHDVEGTSFTEDWNTVAWVSGGPFSFDEWVPGRSISFKRNDEYWKTDPDTAQALPYLDAIEFRITSSPDTLIGFFGEGDFDIIDVPGSQATAAQLSALELGTVNTVVTPVWEHLGFQFGPGRLDRNPGSLSAVLDFRKAVAHAIDRERVAETILPGQLAPLPSFVDVFAPALSAAAWDDYAYDPERARELVQAVKDATGAEELVTSFATSRGVEAREAFAALLSEMLTAVGISLEVSLEEPSEFIDETVRLGTWELAEWAWDPPAPGLLGLLSMLDVFDPSRPPPVGQNYYRWGTEESSVQDETTARFGEIRDEINQTLDPATVRELLAEAEQLLADQVVFIPLYQRIELSAHRSDRFTGIGRAVSGLGGTWNAALWYRVE
jgi:ABC-type transport system substrate-binding protein